MNAIKETRIVCGERVVWRAVDRASRRALYYEAVDGTMRIERILQHRLNELPVPSDPCRNRLPKGTHIGAELGPTWGSHDTGFNLHDAGCSFELGGLWSGGERSEPERSKPPQLDRRSEGPTWIVEP